MGRLIFQALQSLDGYIQDATGKFDWAAPSAEVHAFVNDLERPIGTYLYGRKLYETMAVWQTLPTGPSEPPEMNDYAEIWRAADKVIFSTTLDSVSTPKTRLERSFDADTIRALKASTQSDIDIGGPTLAIAALRAGLVDELRLFLNPVVVGGGVRFLPDDLRLHLELLDERTFDSGVVYLSYGVTN